MEVLNFYYNEQGSDTSQQNGYLFFVCIKSSCCDLVQLNVFRAFYSNGTAVIISCMSIFCADTCTLSVPIFMNAVSNSSISDFYKENVLNINYDCK